MKWPKFTKHDVYTAAAIFGAAFVSTLAKGGSLDKTLLFSAVAAGIAAVIHTYLGKDA